MQHLLTLPTAQRFFGDANKILEYCNNLHCKSFAVDVKEDDDNYVIIAELPGVDKKDVNVGVEDDVLTISTDIKRETDNLLRQERVSGNVVRRFTLPVDANADKINAAMENGVLTLTIPKGDNKRLRKIKVS